MTLRLDAVGRALAPVQRSWSSRDSMLYAVGVGAGQDPAAELEFTTENSAGVEQAALPTYPVVLVDALPLHEMGDFSLSQVVHAGQRLQLHMTPPVEGTADLTPRLTAVYDKGSGAILEVETELAVAGAPLATVVHRLFVRGEGGFGGERGPAPEVSRPDRPADAEIVFQTRPEQALIYRLSGDRNPLHSDPAMAREVGFDRPILHGLCTFGFLGRGLLEFGCDGDPARFGAVDARFGRPVYPGERLHLQLWRRERDIAFEMATSAGTTVVDCGVFEVRGA